MFVEELTGRSNVIENPPGHAQALGKGLRAAFLVEAEDIVMYFVTEANAPVDDQIQPY